MESVTVNILYDNRRIEKWQPLVDELARQGITDYKVWEPVEDTKNVVRSINLSHKRIIEEAAKRREPECIVWEDDCFFPAADGWQYFLNKKPKEFKLYTACNYLHRGHPKGLGLIGFHCYIMHESFYLDFLLKPDNVHIDTAITESVDICYPYAALQRPGFSANNMQQVNYNSNFQKEDVYGW